MPGSATTAVMLAGFMMWGIRPGPLLFTTKADLVWGLIASMYVGNVILLLINMFLIPVFVAMLRIPYSILMGFIIVFASIGAFSVNNSMFEVWLMVGFGLLGYAMKKLEYPIVPLILGMVLGTLVGWAFPDEHLKGKVKSVSAAAYSDRISMSALKIS